MQPTCQLAITRSKRGQPTITQRVPRFSNTTKSGPVAVPVSQPVRQSRRCRKINMKKKEMFRLIFAI
jgi:hypothetical protein